MHELQYSSEIELGHSFLGIDVRYMFLSVSGEIKEKEIEFKVEIGKEIYPAVKRTMFNEAHHALYGLIQDLGRYREEHELDEDEERLVGYAISGLQ